MSPAVAAIALAASSMARCAFSEADASTKSVECPAVCLGNRLWKAVDAQAASLAGHDHCLGECQVAGYETQRRLPL